MSASPTYWRSLNERDGEPVPALDPTASRPADISRRRFLEATGFTLSALAAAGCRPAREELALPSVTGVPGQIPGRNRICAATCAACPAACGLLVTTRDGRPLKLEGMPEHPLSRGGLCAVGQAQPLGLYDSRRLATPLERGQPTTWRNADQRILDVLQQVRQAGGAVRVLTGSTCSPSLRRMIGQFLGTFADGRHVVFDSLGCSAILAAHERTHGARMLPRYRFENARVIVSLGADFLGTWLSPVEFTHGWRQGRIPSADRPEMSYHVQLEGRMSLTGTKADRRMRVLPNEYVLILGHLAADLANRAGRPGPSAPLPAAPIAHEEITALAERLWQARTASLVLSDSDDIDVQLLVNYVNHLLGNYGTTLDITRPDQRWQSDDDSLARLLAELRDGTVAALFIAGTDLLHNVPQSFELAEALGNVGLVVSLARWRDATTPAAQFVCPEHHPLEDWSDAQPVSGLVSYSQPMLAPLGQTRSILESLATWSGQPATAYDIVRDTYRQEIHPRQSQIADFTASWDHAIQTGYVEVEPAGGETAAFEVEAIQWPTAEFSAGLSLTLHANVGMRDSRHAHNAWLHELPDPITKGTWDNYACISPALALEQGLTAGDIVALTAGDARIELPVYIQPGQHDRLVSVALGYGVPGTERFANIGPDWFGARSGVGENGLVGVNAAPLLAWNDGRLSSTRSDVQLAKTGRHRPLATTQEHHTLTLPANTAPHGAPVRDVVQETTLEEFAKDPRSGAPHTHHTSSIPLWSADHPPGDQKWGLVIDLNACTGCSACVVACQVENNIPVVGRDEVVRQREMHWLRIDRYYSGDGDDVSVAHQPMLCQHCDNAPCETVCPVLATVHSADGLNQQAYNRCVGTRYCANNCPYKVRRFNWFDYPHDDALENLALNPDVTVRMRGIMEKCSLCVQRIQEGRLAARRLGIPLADGAIQTACQQSCPAQAITFGNLRDATSAVAAARSSDRSFRVLEELGVEPAVAYLRIVRNAEPTGTHAEAAHG